ncbi:hypothetical protein CK203_116530 [Vitis vinifera]|uniref:BED-type domain-containing protein n=1 Tax=Vitis vinifera TaxID=29760 RepID=A0A438C8D4_VITVI|nr:hypothetical protein CK203_116530 [Vitis vinifera]
MASNLTPSSGQDSTTHSQSSRSKTDPAWEHVSEERYGNGRRALICLYCKKITKGGGIHRMKLHLAGVKGDIGPCKSVPPDVRFRMENSLQEFVNAKKATKEADEYRNPYGPNVSQFEGDMAEGEEEVQEMQSPMAASSGKRKKSTVDKYFAPRNTQGAQPSMRSVLAGKEATWRADMAVGRFFYDACIPTNAVNSFYFKPMLDAISAIGPGYKGPNYYQLRINLLKDAKKEVQLLVDSYRAIWAKVGCTIMGDGWTDNRQRTLINFLVYCPEGISFVKSVDASDIVKDATNLFQLFDEDIGKMDHVAELVRRASKRPSMGYVYEGMYRVRLGIKKLFNYSERLYKPYTEIIKQRWDQQLKKSIHSAAYWLNPCFQYDQENFCNKPNVIGGVMDVIDQKVLKGKIETMNEMRLFRDRLGSFGRDLAYSSREVLQPAELDVEELENLLYEEGSIPINEVEGSSSHIDDEDGGDMAREGLDVENFGFPNAHFQSPYSNFPNE